MIATRFLNFNCIILGKCLISNFSFKNRKYFLGINDSTFYTSFGLWIGYEFIRLGWNTDFTENPPRQVAVVVRDFSLHLPFYIFSFYIKTEIS